MQQVNEKGMQEALNEQESIRTFRPDEIESVTWADVFKDFEWNIKMNVTGENSNDDNMVQTLTTALQIVGSNPQALQNPTFALLFNKIISMTGAVSPLEIDQTIQAGNDMPQENPNVGQVEPLPANNQMNPNVK
jgi:hypothetical protein